MATICYHVAGAVEISEVLLMEISPFKSANLHLGHNVFVASYDHLRTIWERFEVKYLYFFGIQQFGVKMAIDRLWCLRYQRACKI